MLVGEFNVEIISFHNQQDYISTFYDINPEVKLTSFRLDIKSALKNSIANFIHLKKYCKKVNPDLIIGTWYGVNVFLPLFKNTNVKVIGCEHADFNSLPVLIKRVARKLYPKLDAVVVLSEVAKQKMLSYSKKIFVIPNSLPFATDKLATLEDKRILMLGRLVPVKAYERVIPLGFFLKENYPEWRIDIYGDGELRDSLVAQINKNELNNINIHKATKDIETEYLNSSIYLSTSLTEAMPMVFIEAMSCGLPVVSYFNEGSACLISENEDGIMIKNEEELIFEVKRLIENPERRKQLGIKGKEKSYLYTEESIKRQWMNLFEKL